MKCPVGTIRCTEFSESAATLALHIPEKTARTTLRGENDDRPRSECLTRGVALAGPLPPEIQSYITFTGGISANSKSVDGAKELMAFLKSPTAIRVMRSQGMEPGE